ncbi:hypothetical protein ACFQZE_06725 [Paenibacillus sp. GCM10027627]|uniref:hypothetical protein n=1 Tax=unclassified Paenibacillus TaxID=185978 RepID=UPI003645034D
MKINLPQSKQKGNLIELPTPCGNVVNYPIELAIKGTQGKYSLFHTIAHKSGNAYLCATQPDRVRIRAAGTPEFISELYESSNWKEHKISDGYGTFFYKEAPSLRELNDFCDNLSKS